MKSTYGIGAAVIAIALAALVGLAAFGGDSSADGGPAPSGALPQRPRADVVGIAIGQLTEDDEEDEVTTVDLRANGAGGRVGGAFRFFSEEHGYYNGGVKEFSVEDGVIHVSGNGGLFPTNGGRIKVHYEATFHTRDNSATVTVTGAGGYEYTMAGTIDGLVTVHHPPSPAPASPAP